MFEHFLCWWVHYEELQESIRETFDELTEDQRTELWASRMLNERGFRDVSSIFGITSRNLKFRETPRLRLAMVG